MGTELEIIQVLERIEARLNRIEETVQGVRMSTRKSMEWIGTLSEHMSAFDIFRDEVRSTLEPVMNKLDCNDEGLRILRHATVDVSRRIELLEKCDEQMRTNLHSS